MQGCHFQDSQSSAKVKNPQNYNYYAHYAGGGAIFACGTVALSMEVTFILTMSMVMALVFVLGIDSTFGIAFGPGHWQLAMAKSHAPWP